MSVNLCKFVKPDHTSEDELRLRHCLENKESIENIPTNLRHVISFHRDEDTEWNKSNLDIARDESMLKRYLYANSEDLYPLTVNLKDVIKAAWLPYCRYVFSYLISQLKPSSQQKRPPKARRDRRRRIRVLVGHDRKVSSTRALATARPRYGRKFRAQDL